MFKGIRSLFHMLDELDAEKPAAAPIAGAATARALVLDPDVTSAQALAAILATAGLGADLHHDPTAFAAACGTAPPPLAFIDVHEQGAMAIDVLVTLSEHRYRGAVQLMGEGPLPLLEVVRRMGERHGLQMLPVLQKPLDAPAVRQVLSALDLDETSAGAAPDLAEALARDWIEFWYQPKIDLRRMQIAGVETFARVQHPQLGVLSPGSFMDSATDGDLVQLARRALISALGAAARFSGLGINLRLAVNVPVPALLELPIAELVQKFGPRHQRWPGLLLDVTEEQVVAQIPRVQAISTALTDCNVRLAIDDFGRGMLPPSRLRELPFLELKLDRNFVNGCAADAGRAETCRSVINLAHTLDCVAVAVGVERIADMRALAAMGCGLGQGYLFGEPMPEEALAEAMLRRAVRPQHSSEGRHKPLGPARAG
jgi:EAL domain-containing protein (putative c-di-GMP-specific phosphodiesterase class I)